MIWATVSSSLVFTAKNIVNLISELTFYIGLFKYLSIIFIILLNFRNEILILHVHALCLPACTVEPVGCVSHSTLSVYLFSICQYAVTVLLSIRQRIWGTQQWPQNWKRSVFIPIPKKGKAKECSSYRTIALLSHASKVTPKIPQARLQQYVMYELPDVQAGFRKGRGTKDQIANIHWIIEKAREFQKNICFIDYANAFESVDHNKR